MGSTIELTHGARQCFDFAAQGRRTEYFNVSPLLENVLDQFPVFAIRHINLIATIWQHGADLVGVPALTGDPASAKRREFQSRRLTARPIKNPVTAFKHARQFLISNRPRFIF